jgi:GTPase SAR1 family protein
MDNNHIKITVLGLSGAGKTSFMSGLHETLMNGNRHGFHIEPRHFNDPISQQTNKGSMPSGTSKGLDGLVAAGIFDQISFRKLKRFPDGTKRTTEWAFDLLHNQEIISHISWIDYRGGILREPSDYEIFNPDRDFTALMDHITKSQALIICVDSNKLVQYADNIQDGKFISGTMHLSRILEHYRNNKPQSNLTAAIALTQTDKLQPEYKEDQFTKLNDLAQQIFNDLYIDCFRDNRRWAASIFPASAVGSTVGLNEIIQNPDGKITIAPYNMAETLFHSVHGVLRYQISELLKEIRKTETEVRGFKKPYWFLNLDEPIYQDKDYKRRMDAYGNTIAQQHANLSKLTRHSELLRAAADGLSWPLQGDER